MRLIRVIYEPEKVFAEIKEMVKGGWMLPVAAQMILAALTSALIVNMIGLENIVRAQLESRGQTPTPEIMERAVNSPLTKFFTYGAPLIGTVVVLLVVGGIVFGLAQMSDAGTRYGKVLSVTAYSYFAYGLVTSIMSVLVVMLASDRSTLDVQGLIKTNPAIFLDKATTAKPLYSLASSFDLLSFWLIFLLGLGLSKISARMTLGKGLTLVIIPWLVWVVARAGLSALF